MLAYKKVSGLHFCKLGRFGITFYISKPKAAPRPKLVVDTYDRQVRASHIATDTLRPIYGASMNFTAECQDRWMAIYNLEMQGAE